MPSAGSRLTGAVSGVSNAGTDGIIVASPVRKQRLSRNKQELAKEAARIIHQVDQLDSITHNTGRDPTKFYTLPARKRPKENPEQHIASLDRRTRRKIVGNLNNVTVQTSPPPKKPPRTFAQSSPPKTTIFEVFKKPDPSKKSPNIRRSVSDAGSLKSKTENYAFQKQVTNDFSSYRPPRRNKKQLSPIIEVNPREDYFADNKENNNIEANKHVVDIDPVKPPSRKTKNHHSRENIKNIFKDPEDTQKDLKKPEVVIIDLDKATKISKPNLIKEKFNKGVNIGKKLLVGKTKQKQNKPANLASTVTKAQIKPPPEIQNNTTSTTLPKAQKVKHHVTEKYHTAPRIKSTIAALESPSKRSPGMIHSSQQPVDKLPLTKGRTVDSMVKRLSHESTSPPPKTNIMIAPTVSMQHNNNQPFSYIRGPSPDRSPTNPNSPVIYAQVVCNNNGLGSKQTIHTAYTNGKKHLPHSDSDEGLGYEEFSRKFSDSNNKTTNFGDEYYNDDLVEFPITPKYNSSIQYNGFSSYESGTKYRTDTGNYIDSTSRGRGDGMDAKRRESLTEQLVEANNNQFGDSNGPRKDLSARRELLESRINRRFTDKNLKYSPESPVPGANIYTSETTSRYHRSGSASPIGFKDKYPTESRMNGNTDQYASTQYVTKYIGDQKKSYNRYNYDYEPKSFDSQASDYRSSPENRHFEASQDYRNKYSSKLESSKVSDGRDYYKSTPDLRHEYKSNFDRTDSERKDKFGDSGIENDFRRDSGDKFKRPTKQRRDICNDSEDEGFASSLLIASERQHTEDSLAKKKREYEAERGYRKNEADDAYRNIEGMDRYEYAPRERSIDDGSHFDPRIDRDLINGQTLQKIDKKPPKPAKRSSLERVKQLFTRDSKKKKEKAGMVREDSLRARYSEYKGGPLMEGKYLRKSTNDLTNENDPNSRRRLATPSPTRQGAGSDASSRNGKAATSGTRITTITTGTHSSWFKSLDRLARKKTKKGEKDGNFTSTEDERGQSSVNSNSKPTKSLRFFGDTDIDSSNDSARYDPQGSSQQKRKSALKSRHSSSQHSLSSLGREQRARSQSSRELHNISEEAQHNQYPQPPYRSGPHQRSHKSMLNIASSGEVTGSRTSLKPPKSPSRMSRDVTARHNISGDERRDARPGAFRRKNEVSSVESSTEGDSSQQSQRSVVYLHAATVGDIPGPGYLRNGRRAASREDIASNSSSRQIQPQTKTLSRSFSVLAPWKPKHYRESMDIDYTQYPSQQQRPVKNGKYEQRVPKNGSSRKESSSTMLKKKAQETRRSQQSLSTLNRRSRSKENISGTLKRASDSKGSSSSLYKKKERQPKENMRYNSRDDKKLSAKSISVESLGSASNRTGRRSREENREVSRSVSMPRNPEKSAGWFNMSRKSNKKSLSAHRL